MQVNFHVLTRLLPWMTVCAIRGLIVQSESLMTVYRTEQERQELS